MTKLEKVIKGLESIDVEIPPTAEKPQPELVSTSYGFTAEDRADMTEVTENETCGC